MMKFLLTFACTCTIGLMNLTSVVNENDSPVEIVPTIDVDIKSPTSTDLLFHGADQAPSNTTVVDGFLSVINVAAEKMEKARIQICSKYVTPRIEQNSKMGTLIFDQLSLCPPPPPPPPKTNFQIVKEYVMDKADATMMIASESYSHIISSYQACITSIKTGMSTLLVREEQTRNDDLTAEDVVSNDDDEEEYQQQQEEFEEEPIVVIVMTVLGAIPSIWGCLQIMVILESLLRRHEFTEWWSVGNVAFYLYHGTSEMGDNAFGNTCYYFVAIASGVAAVGAVVKFSNQQQRKMAKQWFEQRLKPVTAYHTILGWKVWKWSSTTAIKKEFRKLSLQYHPDKFKPTPEMTLEQATEKMKAINEAYRFITGRN